jgi:pimeloyl-ACP methyl ester carboxylesterase
MNMSIGQENSLSAAELALTAAEDRLFTGLGISIESRFLDEADRRRRIRVLEVGNGRPIVMLHGGNSIAATWAPLWAALEGSFHVFAPDRPGCGLTYRQDYRGIDFQAHAVRFVTRVMDGLGIERASLVGNSMGGYWALLFALAHPDRVERLVLLGEPAGSTRRLSLRHRLGATPYLNRLLFATVARPRPDVQIFAGLMADPARASQALVQCAYAGAVLPGARTAWASMLELVAAPWKRVQLTYALRPELEALRTPVLLAWGDRDFAPVEAGRVLAQDLPDCRFEIVADGGHLLWIDQPTVSAMLVREFLGSDLSVPSRPS